jgi:transposase InsO family protein
VHRSGYYTWLQQPQSLRAKEDKRLLGLIKQSWMASGCVYGYRKVHHDLWKLGESCSKSRVERLMKHYKLKAQIGYKNRRYMSSGEPATVAPNILKRQFDVGQPNPPWITDITYIRTYEGWLYLAINDIDHTKTKAMSPQTNGICERFHKTILNEFYQITFRKKLYSTMEALQKDLDDWIKSYNNDRTHQGKMCGGRTPMETLLDGKSIGAEKNLA